MNVGLMCAAAERLGVVAEPEVITRHLGPATAFVVLASDGVFEFMSNQEVVDLVSACAHLEGKALSVQARVYQSGAVFAVLPIKRDLFPKPSQACACRWRRLGTHRRQPWRWLWRRTGCGCSMRRAPTISPPLLSRHALRVIIVSNTSSENRQAPC